MYDVIFNTRKKKQKQTHTCRIHLQMRVKEWSQSTLLTIVKQSHTKERAHKEHNVKKRLPVNIKRV